MPSGSVTVDVDADWISKMAEGDSELETHDIYLAAYLRLAACNLKRRRRQGPRVYFVFTNPAGPIGELREGFYSGKATVKAHEYSQAIIAMKQLCFDLD